MQSNNEQFMPSLKRLSSITIGREDIYKKQHIIKLEEDTESSEPIKLKNIINKYKIINIQKLFIAKLRRRLTSAPPVTQTFISQQEQHNERWIKGKGVQITYKSFESKIMLGDIIMSIIIFYISVLQAFIEDFRVTHDSNGFISLLKTVAIMFEFCKILLKSIKQQFVNGIHLVYLVDIIRYSAGIFQLVLYFSAISIILLSMVVPVDQTVGIISFIIATIKLLKIPQNLKILEIHFIDSNQKQNYWDLIKVVLLNLLFGHFIAGILIGMAKIDPTHNWIQIHNLQGVPWHTLYCWAFYWAANLTTTTGFGDYASATKSEALIIGMIDVISSIILVMNINLIGTIVARIRNPDLIIDKKLAVFRRMNEQIPISSSVQRKIHCYISFQNKLKELFEFQQRNLLIKQMPEQLRSEYLIDVTRSTFSKLPFFRHLHHQTMVLLAEHFQHRVYYPGEYLFRSQQNPRRSIFILVNGTVSNAYQKQNSTKNGSMVEQMKANIDNESIDPPILLTNTFLNRARQIDYDIIAVTYSLTMQLSQEQLLDIIRQNQQDKVYFFTLYDKHENFIFKNEVCNFCNNEYHSKFQCPKLHFLPMNIHVLDKYLNKGYKPIPRVTNYLRKGLRKEHCYYLRKSFYIPLEEIKEINPKKHFMNLISRGKSYSQMEKDNSSFEDEFLLQCEVMMRKALDELDTEKQMSENWNHCLDCDVLKDFLSYFTECNPKTLISTTTKKEIRTSIRRGPLYTKKLYRNTQRKQVMGSSYQITNDYYTQAPLRDSDQR